MGEFVKSLVEVDEAFYNKLIGCNIDGKEVPVVFISPTSEIQHEEIPSIVIYRNGVYPDMYSYRWDFSPIYTNIDINNLVATRKDSPMPYLVYYVIRVYYEYQEDGAKLNYFVTNKLRRGSYLTINGFDYDIEFVSYSNPGAGYKNFGEFDPQDKKLFYDQYLFKVSVDLDLSEQEEQVKLTSNIIFNPTIKE